MSGNQQRYQHLVKDALLGVMRDILAEVSRHGLRGEQHFFVTFHTHHKNVQLPQHLKERHPESMTIVLQHQFEHLVSHHDCFDVTLIFDGKAARISVPFAAISQFADPDAPFILNMEQKKAEDEEDKKTEKKTKGKKNKKTKDKDNVIALSDFQKNKEENEP